MEPQNQNQNQPQFKCSGICINCLPAQRAYCTCQHALSNMKVLDAIMETVLNMQGDVKSLARKIEAIQNNEASVFDPNEPIAQEGAGADIIEAPKQITL